MFGHAVKRWAHMPRVVGQVGVRSPGGRCRARDQYVLVDGSEIDTTALAFGDDRCHLGSYATGLAFRSNICQRYRFVADDTLRTAPIDSPTARRLSRPRLIAHPFR